MLSDRDCAGLLLNAYAARGTPPLYRDWADVWPVDAAWVARARVGGVDVVTWPGSITPLDWFADLQAFPAFDPVLGWCHLGFLAGVRAVQAKIDPTLGPNVVVTGHSLGAAHAILYAAHLVSIGRPPAAVVVFGEPKNNLGTVRTLLAGIPVRSYRNRQDPVPLVPSLLVPFLGEVYDHGGTAPLIQIDQPPTPGDPSPLRDHHMALYAAGAP